MTNTTTARVTRHGLHIEPVLDDFINTEVLPAVGVDPGAFWLGFDALVRDGVISFAPTAVRNATAAN